MNTPKGKGKVTILWDFPIRTDRIIQVNESDIVIKHKQNETCQLIDMSVPLARYLAIFLIKNLKILADIKIRKLKLLGCGK